MANTADCGIGERPCEKTAATRSDTPFHCSAEGKPNWSVIIVVLQVHSRAVVRQEEEIEERRARDRAGEDADAVPDRLLPRLGARACSPA